MKTTNLLAVLLFTAMLTISSGITNANTAQEAKSCSSQCTMTGCPDMTNCCK